MNEPASFDDEHDSDIVDAAGHSEAFSSDDPDDEQAVCWRCESTFSNSAAKCPRCLAKNRTFAGEIGATKSDKGSAQSPAIVQTVWAFAAMAMVSIFTAVVTSVSVERPEQLTEEAARTQLGWITVVEVLDTIIVLIALSRIKIAPKWPQPARMHVGVLWFLALPLLMVTLALNVGYHYWLRETLGLVVEREGLTSFPALRIWLLLAVCLQPAIVEEFFFRRVALGAALEVIPATQAILVTSLLFAMAHLGMPLSIPVLAMLGAVLGMLRLASGSLLLPIVFHFMHNLCVLLLEMVL